MQTPPTPFAPTEFIPEINFSDTKLKFDFATELPQFWKNNLHLCKSMTIDLIEVTGNPNDLLLFLHGNDSTGGFGRTPFVLMKYRAHFVRDKDKLIFQAGEFKDFNIDFNLRPTVLEVGFYNKPVSFNMSVYISLFMR